MGKDKKNSVKQDSEECKKPPCGGECCCKKGKKKGCKKTKDELMEDFSLGYMGDDVTPFNDDDCEDSDDG